MITSAMPAGTDVPADLDGMRQLAHAMGSASVVPPRWRGPDNLLVAMLLARRLDITLTTVLWEVPVIPGHEQDWHGQPAISAKLARHLMRRAGHQFRFRDEHCTTEAAVAELVRADEPDRTYRAMFTWQEAQVMGLAGKRPYQQMPAEMMRARVTTRVATWYASDVVLGVAVGDGSAGVEPGGASDAAAGVGGVGPMTAEVVAGVDAATSPDELRRLWQQHRMLLDTVACPDTGRTLRQYVLDAYRALDAEQDPAEGVVDLDAVVGATADNEQTATGCECDRGELLRTGVRHLDGCPAQQQDQHGEQDQEADA